MRIFLQVFMAVLGTGGFCLLFHVEKKHILDTAIGGGLCWIAYLLFSALGMSVLIATICASALIGVYGKIFAYWRKAPTTVYYIPACLPLIPGSNLFYSFQSLMTGDMAGFKENALLLFYYAFGIALGLWLVLEVDKIRLNVKERWENKR